MNTSEMINNASTETTAASTSMMDMLGAVVLPPLAFGAHKARLVAYEQKVAKPTKEGQPGNPYLSMSFRFDNEPALRNKAVFEKELGILIAGFAKQLNCYGGDRRSVLEAAKVNDVQINIVEAPDPVTGKTYINWYYQA